MNDNLINSINPYLEMSKNLMELFAIIGYRENELLEYSPSIIEKQKNLKLTIISTLSSDFIFNEIDMNDLIKNIYPNKPNIIMASTNPKINTINIVFSFAHNYNSNNITRKKNYFCYGLRFYEKYIDKKSNNEYLIPKCILIISQYPYFTTFHKICLMIYKYSEYQIEIKIPIEIFIYGLFNYIPSPINNNLILNIFPNSNKDNIYIPKISGYPHIDFNLFKIINTVTFNEFIKIFIMSFIKSKLIFFSPDIEKLNLLMYTIYALNYPLNESEYFKHIKSILTNELQSKEEDYDFIGINFEYNLNINIPNCNKYNFIVEIDNKYQIINPVQKKEDSKELTILLKYIDRIIANKIDSCILKDSIDSLKKQYKIIIKNYNNTCSQGKNIDSYFYIDENIININKQIQEAFYYFIINIIATLNIYYKLINSSIVNLKNKYKKILNISKEENIFYEMCKKINYMELILNFEKYEKKTIPLLILDEFVNLKMDDIKQCHLDNKNTKIVDSDNIKYLKIIDEIYNSKQVNLEINYNYIFEEINKNKKLILKMKKDKKSQLLALDKKIINYFLFNKKNRPYYKSLKEKENKQFELHSINKSTIITTIFNHFYQYLNKEYFIKASIIYPFCIVFPLFSSDGIYFLVQILDILKQLNYFQRYYLYEILTSIDKYYIINKKYDNYPNLTKNIIINHLVYIRDYIRNNLIIKKEEINNIIKKLMLEKKNHNENNENIIRESNNNNNFIYKYDEKIYLYDIKQCIIIKQGNSLFFTIKGKETQFKYHIYLIMNQFFKK